MRDKKLYLEVLRIAAFLFVVFNHTGKYGFDLFTTTDSQALREVGIMLSNLVKCGVPIFLMISGALLIPLKESIGMLYKKRVLKMAVVLAVISFIYYIRLYIKHPEYGFSPKFFIQTVYTQPFVTPLWFIYIYIAFLIMLPLIRRMALGMSGPEFLYIILAGILFTYLPPVLDPYMGGGLYLNIPVLASGFFYPLIGYYLDSVFDPVKLISGTGKIVPMITGKFTLGMVIVLLLNAMLCLYITVDVYLRTGGWSYDGIEAFIMLPSMCIFYLAKSLVGEGRRGTRACKTITYVGSCIFTVYLFEEMIREDIAMNIYRMWSGSCPELILFIPYAVTVFAVGIMIATVLKKIPGVKKYI